MTSDPLLRVEDQRFTAIFMLGAEDDEETVDDVDAELVLPGGTQWSATFMARRAIERVMTRWGRPGSALAGRIPVPRSRDHPGGWADRDVGLPQGDRRFRRT